jgi:hypothetical protein
MQGIAAITIIMQIADIYASLILKVSSCPDATSILNLPIG